MSSPDYRPYLREGDIRSHWDAYRFLRHSAEIPEDATLDDALDILYARMQREIRQACRRGALLAWRDFRRDVGAGDMRTVWDPLPEWISEHCSEYLIKALAFRAAARAK